MKLAKKKNSFIRTEAVVPFFVVVLLIYAYFFLLFDKHLLWVFERLGYEIVGAEVDIAKVETSFHHGTFRMQGIEVTNPQQPNSNMVKIGDIRFGLSWDGLLRARFIVDEMAIERIEIGSPRKYPGRVKPPPPKKTSQSEDSSKPGNSATMKEVKKAGGLVLDEIQNKHQQNVLGDIAGFLAGGGSDFSNQLKNIEKDLPSKQRLEAFSNELSEKKKLWDQRLNSLPQGKDIEDLGKRISAVKTNHFNSVQEAAESIQKISDLIKEAEGKYKAVSTAATDLHADLNLTQNQFKDINALVEQDINNLRTRFRLPHIDGKSLGTALLMQYFSPYLRKINTYRALVNKYVPPNLLKKRKGAGKDNDVSIQPHPRDKGVTYEFGRPNGYPLFWIKRISLSSKAPSNPEEAAQMKWLGNVAGLVTHVTSNQRLINQPTEGQLSGDFPGLSIYGVRSNIVIDNRDVESLVNFNLFVARYPIEGRELINSPDAQVSFKTALGGTQFHGKLEGLTQIDFVLKNEVKQIDYSVSAPNSILDEILKGVFKGIPVVNLQAQGKGELPDIAFDISSNVGPELQKGFEKQVSLKVKEAQAQLQAAIDKAIGSEKGKVAAQLDQVKSQIDSQIGKAQIAIDGEKAKAERQIDQAKKDSVGDIQKQLNDIKNNLGF